MTGPALGRKSSNKWTKKKMLTSADPRLITNGNCWLTEYDDQPDHTWEHNVVAARWTPETGWVCPA